MTRLRLNSLFNLSVIISKCNRPSKPHLNPLPNDPDDSSSYESDESDNFNLSSACRKIVKSSWLSGKIECRYPHLKLTGLVLIAGLTVVSLFAFNRNDFWDETAFYFFGSYGLGILVYWASNRQRHIIWLALLCALVIAALLVDFRSRIAVAGIVMLALGLARQYGVLGSWPVPNFLTYLGRISYSIFLVHFPLCLVVNATFFRFFPHQPVISIFGLILAIGISILGGALLFKWIESRPLTNKMQLLRSVMSMVRERMSVPTTSTFRAEPPRMNWSATLSA